MSQTKGFLRAVWCVFGLPDFPDSKKFQTHITTVNDSSSFIPFAGLGLLSLFTEVIKCNVRNVIQTESKKSISPKRRVLQ
ncbi:hypothetical protein [Paralysiella testudinis]|uniref:Uncharacterized protein n=1 Tax=Paralysiella testudinis TaxID=2809020 RepID=A0A892ZDZ5_9NEIS|nr:hypothetical protein [Paralysiella testudinis]QRQ80850.1 hypothetical protein JQU52_08805 [Paralysiella testudinis]